MRRRQVEQDMHVTSNRDALAHLRTVRGELDRMAAMKGSQLRMALAARAAAAGKRR